MISEYTEVGCDIASGGRFVGFLVCNFVEYGVGLAVGTLDGDKLGLIEG